MIEQRIRLLAPEGLQINIWPCERGFQANVKERDAAGWTCATESDPIAALEAALNRRVRGPAIGDCDHGVPANLRCGACEAETDAFAEMLG